jgi:uncharacterized protein (TIGR02757 family)
VVRRYGDPLDREIIGLVAAGVAFGNVKTIRNKLEEITRRVGPSPHEKADDPRALRTALAGFRHRVFVGDDIARLMIGARLVQKRHATLGRRFASLFREENDLRESLATLADDIRTAGDLEARAEARSRGFAHLLPDPRAGSGVKRLLLYLRWMVRPADGVDFGQWDVPAAALVIPVDTHIHKLARNLALTSRKDLSWKTAQEITAALAVFDPNDPVKYDFSLCHMGMLQRCPSRRDPKRCEGCAVMPVCRHWG